MLATDEILTMLPPPCATMMGSTCLQVRKTLLRLTWKTRSQLASSVSTGPPSALIPTLLCRTSMRPQVSTHLVTRPATSDDCDTSARHDTQMPPSASMIALVSATASSLMSTRKTLAPSRAKSTAVALPLPQPGPLEPAPVTTATLPARRPILCRHERRAPVVRLLGAAADGARRYVAPQHVETRGQLPAIRHREPEAEEQPVLCLGRIVLIGSAAVIDHMIIEKLQVAGHEGSVEAYLLGDFGEQVHRRDLRLGEARHFGIFLRLLDEGARVLARQLAVADAEDRHLEDVAAGPAILVLRP